MIRIAAVADLHYTLLSTGMVATRFQGVNDVADILLIPGDLTNSGQLGEARLLVRELTDVVKIPIVAVLGNHDQFSGKLNDLTHVLTEGRVTLLDGDIFKLKLGGKSLGIVGTKGFQGGFGKNAIMPGFEPAIDVWVREVAMEAGKIRRGLQWLDTDYRVVMLHYAPVIDTVKGEDPEVIPFMGSDRLCDPIDLLGADLIVHGHSHHGTHTGMTPGGIPVYNVAAPVLDVPFAILEVD